MKFRHAADRGDMIMGWMTKIVVVLALLGILGIDGFSILAARFTVADAADQAAQAASDSWIQSKDPQSAYGAALAVATAANGTIPANGVEIAADGTVSVVVNKQAHTFFLRHISKLKSAANVTGHGEARPV